MLKSPYRYAWLSGIFIVIAITVASLPFPFMWDTAYHSSVAKEFYELGFRDFLPSPDIDNGNPTLYPVLLCTAWSLAGHNLLVSHLFFAIVLLFLLAGIIRLGRKFLERSVIWVIPLFLWCDPTTLSQSILMGYDVLMLGLIVWGIAFIMEGRRTWLVFTMMALILVHSRGVLSVAFLFIVQLALGGRLSWRKILPFVAPVIAFIGWQAYHYIQTGWFLLSEETAVYTTSVGINQWFRNAAYSIWRAWDLGRVGIWVLAGLLMILNRRHLERNDRILLLLALTPILIHIVSFSHTMLPVSHRYFMVSTVIISILFLRLLRHMTSLQKVLAISFSALFLLSGNLWFYPQRFGNAWDASLIFTGWPGVEKALNEKMEDLDIDRSSVAAEYPLTYKPSDGYLNADTVGFNDLSNKNLQDLDYIFYSNLSNMYPPNTVKILRNEWIEVWSMEEGRIFAGLYANPSRQWH